MKRIFYLMLVMALSITLCFMMFSCGDNEGDGNGAQSSTGAPTSSSNSGTVSSSAGGSTTDTSAPGTTDTSAPGTTDTSAPDTTDTSTGNGDNTTDNNQPETVNYLIKLVDCFGEPFEIGVDIEVFKNGTSVGESAARRGGARFSLEKGEYTFILKNFDGEYYYNEDACVINPDSEEVTVTVYPYADSSDKQELWIPDAATMDHIMYNAVNVSEGGAYVTIDRAEGTFFIFTPTRGGIYRISYESARSVTFGYYGSPHNVLSTCPVEVVDKAFQIEVKDAGVNTGSGGTTQIVIGISSKAVKGCLLKIERIGNASVDLPWVDVSADKNAVSIDNYINSEFVDFDIKDASLSAVFNEADGYYHLNTVDGPIIYVRLSTAQIKSQNDSETVYVYLPSFILMCDTDRLCKVFYDENGQIVLKESYNDMLREYEALSGTSGLYPLNSQLATAIKNIGEHKGWFDFDSELHIFGEEKNFVIKENAWLFACVYENQYAKGTDAAPAVVTPSAAATKPYAVLVEGGDSVVVRSSAEATLTIANAQGIKLVLAGGTEVTAAAETGVLTAVVGANSNFKIVNEGSDEASVHFTLVEYVG